MKCSRLLLVMCSAFLCFMFVTPQMMGQEKSKLQPSKESSKSSVPRVSEALYIRELAMNGRATKDAYLLIQAAQLAITSSKIPSLAATVKDAGHAPEKKANIDPPALLKEAAQIAGDSGDRQAIQMAAEIAHNKITGLGNDALADEIAKTTVARGFTIGDSLVGSSCMNSGERLYWDVAFRGGENARVIVNASYPLVVAVTDSYGNYVGDGEFTRNKDVQWFVENSGRLRVALGASYGDTCYSIRIP